MAIFLSYFNKLRSFIFFVIVATSIGFSLSSSQAIAKNAKPKTEKIKPTLIYKPSPSLRNFAESLKFKTEITSIFKSTMAFKREKNQFPFKELEKIEKENLILISDFKDQIGSSMRFQRGEIEDESVINGVICGLQLSILTARKMSLSNEHQQIKNQLNPWFKLAAQLPYDESSLVALKFSHVVTSLVLDELEFISERDKNEISKNSDWLKWSQEISLAWPIDRVILAESKKLFQNKFSYTAQKVAELIQKNNYMTASEALAKAQGPKSPELKVLEKLWQTQDIQDMKIEVNRLSKLQLNLAKSLYLTEKKKQLTLLDDLVKEKYLPKIPINYLTGRAFTLEDINTN